MIARFILPFFFLNSESEKREWKELVFKLYFSKRVFWSEWDQVRWGATRTREIVLHCEEQGKLDPWPQPLQKFQTCKLSIRLIWDCAGYDELVVTWEKDLTCDNCTLVLSCRFWNLIFWWGWCHFLPVSQQKSSFHWRHHWVQLQNNGTWGHLNVCSRISGRLHQCGTAASPAGSEHKSWWDQKEEACAW